ncbi:GNAT family N-acetyltransferase [Martelella alba]|uniref:GNAT family N-acetyltransferase n=1 Tax=Martelella alba TaxID=2590451 RepID=A0ABY2SR72_9HYPH|nr:GNAT family N-acetyltransferase [Martelella alba]TKI07890.1 GNAT family N-acetyltransferase [Martelella alba]
MVSTVIETPRLLLCRHSLELLAGYTAFWGALTPTSNTMPTPVPLDSEAAWSRLLRFIGHWTLLGFGPFIVIDKHDNRVIGEVGFAYFHRGNGAIFDEYPEAMWKIDYHYQGKGIASEAVRSAIVWFEEQRVAKRMVSMIDPRNTASLRIAMQCGFRQFDSTTYKNNPVLLFERSVCV